MIHTIIYCRCSRHCQACSHAFLYRLMLQSGSASPVFVCVTPLMLQVVDSADGGRGAPRSAFKFSSVGSQFKKQLGDLMLQLHTMEPHYVRCVKPNGLNKPGLFENANALHQLRCGGRDGYHKPSPLFTGTTASATALELQCAMCSQRLRCVCCIILQPENGPLNGV